jgi:hypothetical protein
MMVFRNPLNHHKVRLAAAEALLKLDAAPAVVTLLKALRREDWKIRQNAAAILGQLQATWAILPLIKALEDAQAEVRQTVADSLRRLGSREALDALTQYEDNEQRLNKQKMVLNGLSNGTAAPIAVATGSASNAGADRGVSTVNPTVPVPLANLPSGAPPVAPPIQATEPASKPDAPVSLPIKPRPQPE